MQMHAQPHRERERERDPVCNMTVTPAETTPKSVHAGTVYHFCSQRCKERFDQDPGKFVAG